MPETDDSNVRIESALKSIVHDLLDNAKDAEKGMNGDDFAKGRYLAYFEIAEMIKSRLEIFDVDLNQE